MLNTRIKAQMKPTIGDKTMTLPILNGVDIALESPGVVNHRGYARLIFGELGGIRIWPQTPDVIELAHN
jgi:hypothetical protein